MVATSTEVGNLVTTTAGLVDPLSRCLLVGRMVKVVGSPLVVMSASVGGWSRWVPALVLVTLIQFNDKMTALISKLKFNTLYIHLHFRIMV